VTESSAGKNPTNGGCNDTDTKEPIVIPCGSPAASNPVTTTTDVGTCPITERKCAESTDGDMAKE
jgi:hypothetical protein